MFAAAFAFLVGRKWLFIGGLFALVIVGSAITIGVIMMQRDRARGAAAQYLADAAIYQAAAQRNAQTIRLVQAINERITASNAADLAASNRRTEEMADIAAGIINVIGPNEACGPRIDIVRQRVREQQTSGR